MHLVTPPERSDAYVVSTAPYGESGPTFYTPGQYIDIHVTTIGAQYLKFLGILIYAVQYADVLGPEGCPSPGCDGKEEVKLGTWEVTNSMFQVSEPCSGQAVTHRNADPKPYNNVFRWKAPEVGSGDVIFRVVIKQGSTNMGHFWWPMTDGDLMLTEGPTETISEWFSGDLSLTCMEICALQQRACDRSMPTGSLDFYDQHVGKTQSCQKPLLSTCSRTAPTRDEDGYCWFDNQDSGLCDQSQPVVNICDAVEVASGSSKLCPCIPTNDDDWVAQSTSAPSTTPSLSPTTSIPTSAPTACNPTSAPTNWFAPRWVEVYNGRTTCSHINKIQRVCKRGCTYTRCKEACAANSRCRYFFFRASHGYCSLLDGCDETQDSSPGVTYRKDVIPTLEPSYNPTFSAPTGLPSVEPTKAPSTIPSSTPSLSAPSTSPSISEPTEIPSVTPTSSPPVSEPTSAPSRWYDPRWVEVYSGTTTCAQQYRFRRACKSGCSFEECKEFCAEDSRCKYFYRNHRGSCQLLTSCDETGTARSGVTVRKDVVPTFEPSREPSISMPTSAPSASAPTGAPTTLLPTKFPSDTPKWQYLIQNEAATCASGERLSLPCKRRCWDDFCRQKCAENADCQFYFKSSRGRCELFRSCDHLRYNVHEGSTWRKELLTNPLDG